MTGSRVAALVVILLGVAAGTGGGLWHLYVTHQIPALGDHPATTASEPSPPATPSPQVASREPAPAAVAPPIENPPVTTPNAAVAPTSPSPASAAPPAPAETAKSPSFDIVRVEPKGDTVVAGKGEPNAKVALMSGGKVLGETTSDANGQFVILPPPLAPGDHDLTLRQTPDGKPATESAQSVAVSVPQPGKGKVVVALAEPGKATKLLSPPPGAAAPQSDAPAPAKVAIRSAEIENGSGLYVSGAAPAKATVHVYLNDSHIADVVAGSDGAWSVRVRHGLTGGHYVVRADAAGATGKVASRAEVPFDVPVAMAETPKPAAAAPAAVASASPMPGPVAAQGAAQPSGRVESAASAAPTGEIASTTAADMPPGADATIESLATARVTRGDNLWNISRFRLGDGMRYTQIYAANADQIRDPNLIYPGQVFVVPNR